MVREVSTVGKYKGRLVYFNGKSHYLVFINRFHQWINKLRIGKYNFLDFHRGSNSKREGDIKITLSNCPNPFKNISMH